MKRSGSYENEREIYPNSAGAALKRGGVIEGRAEARHGDVREVLVRLLAEYPAVRAALVLLSRTPRGWDVLRGVVDEVARKSRRSGARKCQRQCPWYVSAHAVRRFIELARPRLSFDDASDELLALCARTWAHYREADKEPSITRTGAYAYRTPRPLRLHLIVSTERRTEGSRDQVVDVAPAFHGQGQGQRSRK